MRRRAEISVWLATQPGLAIVVSMVTVRSMLRVVKPAGRE